MKTRMNITLKIGIALWILAGLCACDDGGSGGGSSTAPAATGSTAGSTSSTTTGSGTGASTGSATNGSPAQPSATSPAQALVAPQLVSPFPNQVFFAASTDVYQFVWTPVPGATHYILEIDEIQHHGTGTRAKVKLGIGGHEWRVCGVVNGEHGPMSDVSRFSVDPLFASP